MSRTVLVTGGTGTLGRAVVPRLLAEGRLVRVLTRRAGADVDSRASIAIGDLTTGAGVDDALAGVGTVVHLATTNGRRDVQTTRLLVEAARRARVDHVVYMSIVGIDRVPLPYYAAKVAAERAVCDGGVPWTILRATQFPDLLVRIFAALRRLPVMPVPDMAFQPVDVRDVAERLAVQVARGPCGRTADLGGPETLPATELAARYLTAFGEHRRVVMVRVPGRIGRALREGANLTPDHADGNHTFDEFLAGMVAAG